VEIMKRIIIVLMILLITMGVFNMDIMGRPMTDIQRKMVGQIDYGINVVNGIVESENINKTYNCYVAGEPVIYPSIPTFSRNPKLQPGDKVTIEFINGCRETPVILAPEDIRERPDTSEIATLIVAFMYDKRIAIFDSAGTLIINVAYTAGAEAADGDTVAVDQQGNIYVADFDASRIYKLDSEGAAVTDVAAQTPEMIAVAPDGSIWNYNGTTDFFIKRNASTLAIEGSFDSGTGSYKGMAFDSAGYLYTVDWFNHYIKKFDVTTGLLAASRLLTGRAYTLALYSSLSVVGAVVALAQKFSYVWNIDYAICPTNLTTDFVSQFLAEFPADSDSRAITAFSGNSFIIGGTIDGAQEAIIKYNSAFTLTWNTPYNGNNNLLSVGAYPF